MRVTATLQEWEGHAAAPVGAARARVSVRRGLLLTLRAPDGTIGQGEATPLPGYSREPFDDVRAALSNVADALGDDALDAPMEALSRTPVASLVGVARFAVETALLDLCARRRGVALHALLRGDAKEAKVPVSAYVGAALDHGLVDATRAALARGLGTVKVKLSGVGALFAREVSALRALRMAVPGRWRLRLDLNGAWSLAEATPDRFAALASVGAHFVEQPVAVGSLRSLGWQVLPWAIDESLLDEGDLAHALTARESGGCVAAVATPSMSEGLSPQRASNAREDGHVDDRDSQDRISRARTERRHHKQRQQ